MATQKTQQKTGQNVENRKPDPGMDGIDTEAINKSVSRRGKIESKIIEIRPPNFRVAVFTVRGTSPLVGNKFSSRAKAEMRMQQEAGSTSKKGRKREPKDFEKCCREATHVSTEGWEGIPAPAFRNGMISACKAVGFAMTRAKISVFVEADGYDLDDGTPLVRITKGKARYAEHFVRNDNGSCDLRARPMWNPGWEAEVKVRFDADQFTPADVANLLARVGVQVGICAGRPDSRNSCGMGWGLFEVSNGDGHE